MKTLEEILKDYKFMPKSKNAFRKYRIWIDDRPEDMTKEGYKGYEKLTDLLYDIADLIDGQEVITRIIDELDSITTENY